MSRDQQSQSAQVGTGSIRQSPRRRDPGFTMRPQRIAEWLHLAECDLRRRQPDLSDAEVRELAEQRLDEMRRSLDARDLVRAFEASAPTSTSPARDDLYDEVELAAVMQLPVMRWLKELLLAKTNRRGPAAKRDKIVATFLQLAFGKGRPEVAATRKAFECGHPLLSWAHDHPEGGPAKSQTYASLQAMLLAKPAEATIHANIELLRQLSESRDAKGKLLHPDIGLIGVVDGTSAEAETEQRPASDPAHRAILRQRDQELVGSVVYRRPDGSIWRGWTGYKLVVISDLASTLPICWKVIPANGDEREATLELLAVLFEIWPDCPMEALVGDSLYDHSRSFAHKLVFEWGLQPIFPKHGSYSADLPHAATDGVPVCCCDGLMKLKDDDGKIYTAKRRAKLGIARGEQAPEINGRLRWVCANGICAGISTRPCDDPRLYTYYPRAGEHARAIKRRVCQLRRNGIESLFASLKNLGLGDDAQDRAGWAGDEEMVWLLSAGLLFLTARRLAHETGSYDEALAEAEALGLLDAVTKANPAPGPDELTLARAKRQRIERIGDAAAPRSWLAERADALQVA